MEEVPRRTSLAPLASLCFLLCLIGVEAEGLLDYEERAGIISIVRWNLRPVIFGVDRSGGIFTQSVADIRWINNPDSDSDREGAAQAVGKPGVVLVWVIVTIMLSILGGADNPNHPVAA